MESLRAKTKELFKSALDETKKKNSLLNMQEMESGAVKLNAYPRRIVLEMTSACNIKCIFCGRDEAEFNQTYLKIDVLDKLSNALKHCEEVTLFGWGEPTINPKFSQIAYIYLSFNISSLLRKSKKSTFLIDYRLN